MAGKPRAECRVVPESVWALVRQDYCAGLTAQACCAKYGVAEAGLRGRAAREGWHKSKGLAQPAERRPIGAFLAADLSADKVRRAALARATEALTAGRAAEAVEIVRALEEVLELAAEVEMAEAWTALDTALDLLTNAPAEAPPALVAYVQDLAESLLRGDDLGPTHNPWAERWRAERLSVEHETE